jgi:hypothetical protein
MNSLSRDFTKTEKVLLLFFGLILVALAYYFFVDQPVRRGVEAAEAERSALQIELTGVQTRLTQLEQMQAELDRIGSLDSASWMGSYNNSKAELAELNNILEAADSYAITFANAERDGDQIRRNFSLQFSVPDYETFRKIVGELENCRNRCIIGNLNYRDDKRTVRSNVPTEAPTEVHSFVVDATATFFETMYNGVEDAGLPVARNAG